MRCEVGFGRVWQGGVRLSSKARYGLAWHGDVRHGEAMLGTVWHSSKARL